MRLTGDIQVFNRLLPSHNIPGKRAEWSYLTIGYYGKEKGDIYILHQTQRNGNGVKYKVFGNLTGIFTKCIAQGKITMRFKNPSHDLLIHSSEEQLRRYCAIVQQFMKGEIDGKSGKFTNLFNVPSKVGSKPKTKLHIKSKKDIAIVDPFPRTLEELKMDNSSLTFLDSRIFRLQKLKILNLENNSLETLPNQLSLLPCLRELHLAGNLLGHTPLNTWLLADNFQTGLVYLDLRRNNLHTLPSDIYKLKKLKTLLLDDNLIFNLASAFGRLAELKELRLSNNKLLTLPASFRFLYLDVLDISCNPGWLSNYHQDQNLLVDETSSSLSLLDICAKVVLNNRLEYDRKILPLELITYLDSACYCVCGQATFPSKPEGFTKFDIARICVQVTFTECNLPIEVRFCSNRCRTTCSQR